MKWSSWSWSVYGLFRCAVGYNTSVIRVRHRRDRSLQITITNWIMWLSFNFSSATQSTTVLDFVLTSPSSLAQPLASNSSTTTTSTPSRRKRALPGLLDRDQLSSRAPPCNDLSKRSQLSCTGNEKLLGDCAFQPYGTASSSLLKLTCLQETGQNTRMWWS